MSSAGALDASPPRFAARLVGQRVRAAVRSGCSTGQEAARLRAEQDLRGFDELLRESRRGREFLDVLGLILGDAVVASGPATFVDAWARASASRAPHVSALATPVSTGMSLALSSSIPEPGILASAPQTA